MESKQEYGKRAGVNPTGIYPYCLDHKLHDRTCADFHILQELFDNFDYHSSLDNVKTEEKTAMRRLEFVREHFWLCDLLLYSFPSCFVVHLSYSALKIVYSWVGQLLTIWTELFIENTASSFLWRSDKYQQDYLLAV